ncbi:MAG TPA: tetratricopeptide repeat protein [Planctomycetes bacterium]|nr:tetratricopeptide repeat protein [Planctomycetota bacterium]
MRFSLSLVLLLASCGLYPGFRDPEPPKGMALRAFERDLGLFASEGGEREEALELAPLSEDRVQAYIRIDRDADREIISIREKNKGLDLSNLPREESRVGRLARAKGLNLLGRLREARTILEGLLQEDPDFFPAIHLLAWEALDRGDLRKARRGFREVVARQPDNISAQIGLARCLFGSKREKDHAEGERILENLMEHSRDGASAAQEWIKELLRVGLPEKALAVAKRAEKLFPKRKAFWLFEVKARFDIGDFKGAAEVAKTLTDKPGPFQAPALHYRFMALRALGDFDGALEDYRILKEGNFQDYILKYIGKGFFLETEPILEKEQRLGRRVLYDPMEVQVQAKRNKDPNERKRFLFIISGVRNPNQKASIDRTLTWALEKDPDLGVRKLALGLLQKRNPGDLKPLLLGLSSEEPILRIQALTLMVTLPVRVAIPRILAQMEKETDPRVFRKAHEILGKVSGKDVYLSPGAENHPQERAKLCQRWRKALEGKKRN